MAEATFNLIEENWIPVLRASGKKESIAPYRITETHDPIIKIAAPRPDFNGALAQFLIGLVQTIFAPENEEEWEKRFEKPPTPEELKQAFLKVKDAF